jgi:hypothetical protein
MARGDNVVAFVWAASGLLHTAAARPSCTSENHRSPLLHRDRRARHRSLLMEMPRAYCRVGITPMPRWCAARTR